MTRIQPGASVTPTEPVGPADLDVQVQVHQLPEQQRGELIRCAACGQDVTSPDLAIAAAGRHVHTFRNPAGYSWGVACFRDAPGCRSVGELTTEASWFAGYAWRFAHCRRCGRHLGWWYVAATAIAVSAPTAGEGPPVGVSSFVGLIGPRLQR